MTHAISFARIMRMVLLPAMLLTFPVASHAAEGDKLARLSVLIGTWNVEGAAGSTTFERALNNRVIVRKSWAQVPASGTKPAAKHEDLMVIFSYGDHLRAAYYDSEGYVVGYEVQAKGKNIVLLSDAMQGIPRARLTYTLGSNGVLAATVEMAPANNPEAFAPSMAWNSRRAQK